MYFFAGQMVDEGSWLLSFWRVLEMEDSSCCTGGLLKLLGALLEHLIFVCRNMSFISGGIVRDFKNFSSVQWLFSVVLQVTLASSYAL